MADQSEPEAQPAPEEPRGSPRETPWKSLPGSFEDAPIWYGFALAVVALAPPPLVYPAVLAASGLGAHLMGVLHRVRFPEAREDASTARFFVLTLPLVTTGVRFTEGYTSTTLALASVFFMILMMNALHNTRVMVQLAHRKAGKVQPKSEAEAP